VPRLVVCTDKTCTLGGTDSHLQAARVRVVYIAAPPAYRSYALSHARPYGCEAQRCLAQSTASSPQYCVQEPASRTTAYLCAHEQDSRCWEAGSETTGGVPLGNSACS